jgi:hypothetical protein
VAIATTVTSDACDSACTIAVEQANVTTVEASRKGIAAWRCEWDGIALDFGER